MTSTALVLTRDDRLACRSWIQRHSKSFFLSSLLLPARVRQASWALYAFCRRADDAVDAGDVGPRGALARVESLRRRLDAVYAGRAGDDPIDRAFGAVVERYGIDRALPEELLAGMEMDARGATYADDGELLRYCFRVASTVGLMMTRVMGASDDAAYLRAADLGVAMQLTNIARDVGEDARRGRVYLPATLLDEVGLDGRALANADAATAPMRAAVKALLARAEAHYRAADVGIPLLPRDCRLAIASSRRIYAMIGDAIAANGYDSITRRAYVTLGGKLRLVAGALPIVWSRPLPPTIGPADGALAPLVRAAGLPA
ncbi:MAG TPA: phytoene/squalene synthase family protein [Polyangia bacterium]|nr:phytoene/squalene synthase family protein [Polyangia bacterium]